MYRIDNDTAISALPTPGAVGVNPNYYYTGGNPGLGVPATIFDADAANAIQEEICAVIEGAGLTLDKTSHVQLLAAIKLIIAGGGGDYVASTTAANTYVATLSPAPSAYAAGQFITVKFSNHNTSAATINFNSLGAKSIKRVDGTAISAYDIFDSMIALLVYDGTNFILCNQFDGFRLQNDEANYAPSTTAANTYTATLNPAPVAYTTGMRVTIKFTNTNTAAATINLNSLGAKAIVLPSNAALAGGEIINNGLADLRYDGTSFVLMNSALGTALSVPQVTTYTTGSGNYTTPASALYLIVECQGGGGGGGSSASNGNNGSAGGNTTFGTALLSATGGNFGRTGTNALGTIVSGTGGDINIYGGQGTSTCNTYTGSGYSIGGMGGASFFGGGGGGLYQTAGAAGAAAGSGGGGGADTAAALAGHGGCAGGYVKKLITPTAGQVFAYAVGAGGAGGSAGSTGLAGGAGAAGLIIVTAYFQ